MTLIELKKQSFEMRFDMTDPCKECPFRKSTPPNRKGLDAEKLEWILGMMMGGDGCHSCHLTDPRSDCESAQAYVGPLQHCMGFARMMEKSHVRTDFIQGAIEKCAVRMDELKDPKNEVHSIRDLAETLKEWAEGELNEASQ
jgi:hypothetical protein